jgi:hypothetical protein
VVNVVNLTEEQGRSETRAEEYKIPEADKEI